MISQTSEYALRAAVHLARHRGGPVTAQDISNATQVPLGYLHKILRTLVRAKILIAQRGVGGGFALARTADEVTVLDVLRATDSELGRIERCPLGIEGHQQLCALHRLLDRVLAISERVFAGATIASLIAVNSNEQGLCDPGRPSLPLFDDSTEPPPETGSSGPFLDI